MSSYVKPGMPIDLVFELDPNRVRKTNVYDVAEDNQIILAQPSPPLLRSHTGQTCQASFVVKRKEQRDARLAFDAVVQGYLTNYEISASHTVHAVVIKQLTKIKEIDRRMHYRVTPLKKSGLEIIMDDESMSIGDISLQGAKLVNSNGRSYQYHDRKRITLHHGDKKYVFNATIIRLEGKYICVHFDYDGRELERILGSILMMIEREYLAEGLRG